MGSPNQIRPKQLDPYRDHRFTVIDADQFHFLLDRHGRLDRRQIEPDRAFIEKMNADISDVYQGGGRAQFLPQDPISN